MLQLIPPPAGRGSFSVTPAAVPVPAALLLPTVTVNPTGDPAATIAESAALATVSTGGPGLTDQVPNVSYGP